MEQPQTNYLKTVMYYGLVSGAILIGYSLLLQLAGQNTNQLLANLTLALLAACIYFSTKQFRDKYRSGFINYTDALGFGLLTGVFAAVLVSFFAYLAVKFEPSIIDKQLELSQEEMLKKGLDEDTVEQATNITKNS